MMRIRFVDIHEIVTGAVLFWGGEQLTYSLFRDLLWGYQAATAASAFRGGTRA
jgi:hypothetical protein